jgi:desulfoferrodoxin-like iron-binding protein
MEVMNMTSHKDELYYCEICGAEVEVKKGGDGSLVCCGQAMTIKET